MLRRVSAPILPRSFDIGFAAGPMVKDVRLCLQERRAGDWAAIIEIHQSS
jgi:hypothetical protein